MKPIYTLFLSLTLIAFVFIPVSAGQTTYITPSILILNVVPNQSVTITASNFPANDVYEVLMGYQGTQGINGIKVANINSDNGNFSMTINIPPAMAGQPSIAIRLQSPYSGYYSYNWFHNTTNGNQPAPLPNYGIPTFSILGVISDQSVSILTANFPTNDLFDVYMGAYGTQASNGVYVATINSGYGGSFSISFNIPPILQGNNQISIRLQSPSSGYYAYNWFYNQTIALPSVPLTNPYVNPYPYPSYSIPTISIVSVIRDLSVTILTSNFPPNDVFDVYMGGDSTQANPGIKVTSFNSGNGGGISASFNIPSALAGSNQITIRLQSPYSGYYSNNWFYNNTYP